MTAKLILDKLGRIVLPKPLLQKLQLAAGDELELQSMNDRIILRPSRGSTQLRKKHGVWISHRGEPLSAATVQKTIEGVKRMREDRNRRRDS